MLRSSFILAAQLFLCVFLVMLGWGLGGLSSFLLDPARVGLILVVLAGALAATFLGLELHPLRTGPASLQKQNLQLVVLWILSVAVLWFLPFADRRRLLTLKWEGWRYVGLLLCGIGIAVRIWAMKDLGKYFSAYVTLQPEHRLVRQGIYEYIRHPLYLSLLLGPAGVALVFSSMLALPIFILAEVFVSNRMRQEELLLAANFGREFDDYQRRTWRLIPRVF